MRTLTPERLLEELGIPFLEKSNRLQMLCPWHEDTDPSSGFYLDSERWYCFSCELLLDTVAFYAKYMDVSRDEASRDLRKRYLIPMKKTLVNKALIHRIRQDGERDLRTWRADGMNWLEHARKAEALDRLIWQMEQGIPGMSYADWKGSSSVLSTYESEEELLLC